MNIKSPSTPSQYQVGTLSYTKWGLISVFFWILWGDFCLNIMEAVVPNLLPLRLKQLEASNATIALIMSTIPGVMNMLINPVISFKSDRLRTRWGRRIPILLLATPFITLFMALIGFSKPITEFLFNHVTTGLTLPQLSLLLIGMLVVGFQFFNMFVMSVFFYLYNDVIPKEFIGRFLALFRLMGILGQTVFNLYLLKHAETHFEWIFKGSALLYMVAFCCMCWKVKEGEYPPIEEDSESKGFIENCKLYIHECFRHKIYWLLFIYNSIFAMAMVTKIYDILYMKHLGFSLEQIGQINATVGVLTALLLYPFGVLLDRWHPFKMLRWGLILMLLSLPLRLVFLFADLTPQEAFYIWFFGALVIDIPQVMCMTTDVPVLMKIFPKDRFGQFCSANAFVRSLSVMGAVTIVGILMDQISKVARFSGDEVYKLIPLWQMICFSLTFVIFIMLVREWRKKGGDVGYLPPV